MLQLEIKDGMVYLSTDNRFEVLDALSFLVKEYKKLEQRDCMQVTILDVTDQGK